MPLKVSKRENSPFYQITGTFRGVRIRKSTGTHDKEQAERERLELEQSIISQLRAKGSSKKTFADAIISYIENKGEIRFLDRITRTLGKLPLDKVNQEEIDRASRLAYPPYRRGPKGQLRQPSSATIKRQFYVPVAAIMHHAADLEWMPYKRIKMPKTKRPPPKWADRNWFKAFFEHADVDLKAAVTFLMGTGCRVSEMINLSPRDVFTDRSEALVRTTKNGDPRMVYLPGFVLEAIGPYVNQNKRTVFFMYETRFKINAEIEKVCKKANIEYLSTHKVGSHTFATNLARLEGMDAKALTETGRWKDPKSTYHYTHYLRREQASKSDALEKLLK